MSYSNIKMKKILVLGAGEMQVPIIRKIKELGYCSIAVDYDANACGFPYADDFYVESSTDYEKVLSIAQKCRRCFNDIGLSC